MIDLKAIEIIYQEVIQAQALTEEEIKKIDILLKKLEEFNSSNSSIKPPQQNNSIMKLILALNFVIILFLILIFFKIENISPKKQLVTQTQTKTIMPPTPKKPLYKIEYFCKNETPLKAQAVFYVKLNDKFIPIYKIKDWNGKGILFKPYEVKKVISVVNFNNKKYYEIKKEKYLTNTKNSVIKCYLKKIKE